MDVRKALDSLMHHLKPINSISTTPKNYGLLHVQSALNGNMEVDLQDDRKHRREGVLAMALDSTGKALVTTNYSSSSLDNDSSSIIDLAKSAEQAHQHPRVALVGIAGVWGTREQFLVCVI